MVGPVGFEPTTNGFTLFRTFLPERTISSPSASRLSFGWWGAGRSSLLLRTL